MKITVLYKKYSDSPEKKIEITCRLDDFLIEALEEGIFGQCCILKPESVVTYQGYSFSVQTINEDKVKDFLEEGASSHTLNLTRYPYPRSKRSAPKKPTPVQIANVNGCLMPIGDRYTFDEKKERQTLLKEIKNSPLFREDMWIRETSPLRYHPTDPKFPRFNANFIGGTLYSLGEGIDSHHKDHTSFTRFIESTVFRQDKILIQHIGRIGIPGEDFWDFERHPWIKGSRTLSEKGASVIVTEYKVRPPGTKGSRVFLVYDFPYRETEPVPTEYFPAFMELYKKSEIHHILWTCHSGSRRSADHILRCLMMDYRKHIFIKDDVQKRKNITMLIDYLRLHRNIRLFDWQIAAAHDAVVEMIQIESTFSDVPVKDRKKLTLSFDDIQKKVAACLLDPEYREFVCTEDQLFPYAVHALQATSTSNETPINPFTPPPGWAAIASILDELQRSSSLSTPAVTSSSAGASSSVAMTDDSTKKDEVLSLGCTS